MSNPAPSIPPTAPVVAVPVDAASSASVWDRISTWVSENKVAVYVVAGVTIAVTGAGVVYYLNSDSVRLGASIWGGPSQASRWGLATVAV